jgi:hypothetical protein
MICNKTPRQTTSQNTGIDPHNLRWLSKTLSEQRGMSMTRGGKNQAV